MSADVKMQVCLQFNGDWPSGKAPVFGTGIRGFESLIPSQAKALWYSAFLFYY